MYVLVLLDFVCICEELWMNMVVIDLMIGE